MTLENIRSFKFFILSLLLNDYALILSIVLYLISFFSRSIILFLLDQMVNLKVNIVMNYAKLLGSATKIPMLLPKYYDQWEDRMEDYLNWIHEDLWRSIKKGPCCADLVQAIRNAGVVEDMIVHANKQKENDKRCL